LAVSDNVQYRGAGIIFKEKKQVFFYRCPLGTIVVISL
jgi:hypothetical protein